MAIVRIDEVGFGSFTGDIGGIKFVDGVSVEHLSAMEIGRLSASMRISEVESGEQVGVGATLVALRTVEAHAETHEMATETELVQGTEPDTGEQSAAGEAKDGSEKYTREQLEAMVDTAGVAGIRSIASKLGVKGRSIVDLIDGILKVQG